MQDVKTLRRSCGKCQTHASMQGVVYIHPGNRAMMRCMMCGNTEYVDLEPEEYQHAQAEEAEDVG